jgi:serine/threonine protein phosphatase PrpC
MALGVHVECTLNGMVFDGRAKDPIEKATRDAVLAFMAAQGEADYRNRAEMQRRGVAIAKAEGKYKGRARSHDYAAIKAWREERGASIRETAEKFSRNTALGMPDGGGMGTTLTGFWHAQNDGVLVVFHIGDSRLYRYRPGDLALLTRDQTLYQEAIESGAIDNLPARNLLLQAVGPSASIKSDVGVHELQAEDLFMLCSDGLHGSVPYGEIESVLAGTHGDNLEQSCARLIALAKECGGRDNITVVLAWCE